jgi:hypothetical protein
MFKEKNSNNIIRKKMGQVSFYVLAVGFVLSAVIFLFLAERMKEYQAELSIIFISKSETSAIQSEQIIENILVLPKTLSFYEKFIRNNEKLGITEEETDLSWDEQINIERKGESSVFKITAFGKNPEKAKFKSRSVAFTLFGVMSHYYDIKNDVDFRIIEGPISKAFVRNWVSLIILSLALGLISSLVFGTFIRFFLKRYRERKDIMLKRIEEISKISHEQLKKFKKKPEDKNEKSEISINQENIFKTPVKTSSAPENLPIAQGDFVLNKFGLSLDENPIEEEIEKVEKEEDTHREPTQEELKRRLNQLLQGKL